MEAKVRSSANFFKEGGMNTHASSGAQTWVGRAATSDFANWANVMWGRHYQRRPRIQVQQPLALSG
jgi:hypothetical protein